MRSATILAAALNFVNCVVGHATFQQLWIDGVDKQGTCARLPVDNSPIRNLTSNDLRCNANQGSAASKCSVAAGSVVTIEMHVNPNDRSCTNEAIYSSHLGPVIVYLSKVADSATADGSTPFFKIYQDTWRKLRQYSYAAEDYWGTKDLIAHCGKLDVKIPDGLAPGDYLLRAELIALHAAGSLDGAQLHMTCYQLTITGDGTINPPGVTFPGAYKSRDPGIYINLFSDLKEYVAPGPAVIPGGTEAVAGKAGSIVGKRIKRMSAAT